MEKMLNSLKSKVLSIMLLLTLIVTMIPMTAYAQNESNETNDSISMYIEQSNPLYLEDDTEPVIEVIDVDPLSSTEDEISSNTIREVEYVETVEEAATQLRANMVERESNPIISVKVDELTDEAVSSTVEDIFNVAIEHTGKPNEGDSLKWVYKEYYSEINGSYDGTNYYIVINYNITYYTTAEQEAELSTMVENLKTELALEDKTDYEKVKAVYDYMTANIEYDYNNLNDDSNYLKYTAYAALGNKTSVCQGYATLFYRMACEYGIDARVIAGTSLNNQGVSERHSWNIVKLGEKYYNLDATWDAGADSYACFLKCDSTFVNHDRDDEYKLESFINSYPISEVDWGVKEDSLYWSAYASETFSGGEGTEESPYLISTPEELAYLAVCINMNYEGYEDAYYKVISDLDLEGRYWVPIGYGPKTQDLIDDNENYFKGTFDGNGHTIYNMNIKAYEDVDFYGLFGASKGVIENVQLVNANIDLTSNKAGLEYSFVNVGLLVGKCDDCAKLLNNEVAGSIKAQTAQSLLCGGVVGSTCRTEIYNNHSNVSIDVEVEKAIFCGGVIGSSESNTITLQCSFIGDITVKNDGVIDEGENGYEEGYSYATYIGGFAGTTMRCTGDVEIRDCFAISDITTEGNDLASVGGFSGCMEVSRTGIVLENLYCKTDILINNTSKNCFVPSRSIDGDLGCKVSIKNCSAIFDGKITKYEDFYHNGKNEEWYYWFEDGRNIESEYACDEIGYVEFFDTISGFSECVWNVNDESLPTLKSSGTHSWTSTGEETAEYGQTSEIEYKCGKCDQVKVCYSSRHSWEENDIVKEQTCNEDGIVSYSCSYCDTTKNVIIKAGHKYGDWIIDTEPTCTKVGMKYKECECGHTVQEEIQAKGHDLYWVDKKEATCTENGDEGGNACRDCAYTEGFNVIPAGHRETVTKEAKAATCTEAGWTEEIRCERCESVLTASEEVAATGHDHTSVITEPTCTEAGFTTYTCACGDTYTADEVDKLGHKETVTKEAKAATCTESGWTEEISCERCEAILTASEEVAVTGHTWNTSYTIDKKATASKNGSKSIHCSKCNVTKSKTAIYYPKTVKLSTTSYTYNGKAKKPTVKVYNSKGKLIATSNYTVKYATGRKNVGKYKVTVTFKPTSKEYSGSKYTTFKINPKGTTFSTVTKGKKSFIAKWKKQPAKMSKTRITGYQIRYSTSSKMTNSKVKTVKGYGKTSLKVSKLKDNKKYYVQVRTYKTVNGSKYYSTWSKYKTVRTKN